MSTKMESQDSIDLVKLQRDALGLVCNDPAGSLTPHWTNSDILSIHFSRAFRSPPKLSSKTPFVLHTKLTALPTAYSTVVHLRNHQNPGNKIEVDTLCFDLGSMKHTP